MLDFEYQNQLVTGTLGPVEFELHIQDDERERSVSLYLEVSD